MTHTHTCFTAIFIGLIFLPSFALSDVAGDGPQLLRAPLLQWVAEEYQPSDYTDRGKYSFPKAIARFELHGPTDTLANQYVDEYADGYEFFHFPFFGMARLMFLYPEAPAIQRNRSDFLRRILLADSSNHYNALTGEGTENHITMSRTSGYLFACLAMDHPDPAVADTAAQWKRRLAGWIFDWSRRALHVGTGEWDSSVYTFFNLVGWLNLYDFAPEPDIRKAARAVLDHYAAHIALKITDGIYGGPESRGTTQYGGTQWTATEALADLWFGPFPRRQLDEFPSTSFIYAVHAATSSYTPPHHTRTLARKDFSQPRLYHNTKPSYLMTRPAESRESFLIAPSFTLGSAETPYSGWTNAAYGVVNWKLILRHPQKGPAVVWGNGAMKSDQHARGRNPFDQFLQHGPVLVQMSRQPANAGEIAQSMRQRIALWQSDFQNDFSARWGENHPNHMPVQDTARGKLERAADSVLLFPRDWQPTKRNGVFFFHYGDSFFAARPLSGSQPVLKKGRLIDSAQPDSIAGFVLEVSGTHQFKSYETFQEAVLTQTGIQRPANDTLSILYSDLDGNRLRFRYQPEGTFVVADFDWAYGVRQQRVFHKTNDWRQPQWPAGMGHGRLATLFVNGIPRTWSPRDPVLAGPGLLQHKGVLRLGPLTSPYNVDFSGPIPQFTSPGNSPHRQSPQK